MELEGRILDGRYRLGSLLGVGGMARVYLASDWVLERQVAVKVLSPSDAQDALFVERFRREAHAAATRPAQWAATGSDLPTCHCRAGARAGCGQPPPGCVPARQPGGSPSGRNQ